MQSRSSTDTLLAAVHTFIQEHHLLSQNGSVVVGVSGGPDSVCLLHVLMTLCTPEGPFPNVKLHVAHLDHGVRGEASRADAAFVADLAADWGLPCTVEHVDVPALARAGRRSLEDVARQARYAFLRRVAEQSSATRIAVAHHADDQVETLVMHWLRGSGLAGLAGMRPLEGEIIRPLLVMRRAEVLAYCQEQQLPFREDASNQDRRFLRNRIRHELLPTLEQYNLNLRETLLRNATILAEEAAYLEQQLAARWPEVIASGAEGQVEGSVPAYRRLPLALRRRLLVRAGEVASAGKTHLELRHVEACDALLLRSAGSGLLHLPGGLRLRRVYERFFLELLPQVSEPKESSADSSPASAPQSQSNAAVPMPQPGEARLPWTPWRVRARVMQGAPAEGRASALPPGYEHESGVSQWGYMDGDALQPYLPLSLRTRRAGDRFRPLGMAGEKKLQDVFVDAKIPRMMRATLPLVCGADGRILWVPGYLVSDLVKLTPATQRVLALELRAASDTQYLTAFFRL